MQALRGEPLTIYRDGSQTRSFCYVDDLIGGMILLMRSENPGPINIGNPREFTIRGLAELIRNRIQPNLQLISKPLPQDDPIQRQTLIDLAQKTWTGSH